MASRLLFAKPRKRAKIRKPLRRTRLRPSRKAQQRRREESQVIRGVRQQVAARDGRCRLAGVSEMGECAGPGEWAHLAEAKRFKTRKQAPEVRHSTRVTAMLCRDGHHHAHDKGVGRDRLHVEYMTPHGADGRMRFTCAGIVYEELA